MFRLLITDNLHKEANLSGRLVSRTLQNLRGEMGCEWYQFAGYEAATVLITERTQWWSSEQRSQIERRQGVEDNNFMGGVGVDGIVQREVGRGIVESEVQGRCWGGE